MNMNVIKRVLISVTDKKGIVDFARELAAFNVEILSTGGTAAQIRNSGIAVKDVSDYTGFPEMMDGRLKTLHPKIHGGLLALRDNENHMKALAEHGIDLIDMVVINLYEFEKTVAQKDVPWTTPSRISISAGRPCSGRHPRTTASLRSSPSRMTTAKSSPK